jgi:hypothetical protein
MRRSKVAFIPEVIHLSPDKRLEREPDGWAMFYQGWYVGSRRSQFQAEQALNEVAYEALRRDAIDTRDNAADYAEAMMA